MHIMHPNGGLGSQFFQYAFARVYGLEHRCRVYIDINGIQGRFARDPRREDYAGPSRHAYPQLFLFNTVCPLLDDAQAQRFRQLPLWNVPVPRGGLLVSDDGALCPMPLEQRSQWREHALFEGYFFDEPYFAPYRTQLLSDLTLRLPLDLPNQHLLQRIRACPAAVMVHVRRGDFVIGDGALLCTPQYYRQAARIMCERVPGAHFFVFSNDLPWVQEHLSWPGPYTAVAVNTAALGCMELQLMRACRHFIIANSTFSWWAAWLGEETDKIVIAPHAMRPFYVRRFSHPCSWIYLQGALPTPHPAPPKKAKHDSPPT